MNKALYPALFIAILLLAFPLKAQYPAGDLYLVTNSGMHFISYPATRLNQLDTLPANNFTLHQQTLYVSGYSQKWTGIASYDPATHQRLGTHTGLPALDVDSWSGGLVVTCQEAPYLRVVDPAMQYSEIFSELDTLPGPPMETLVLDDRAYVLFGSHVAIVDLDLENTLAVIRTDTIPGFWSPLYNGYIAETNGEIFLYGEYATGAIRSALLQIDPLSLTASLAAHVEFRGARYPPVGVDEKLYVYEYPSHYSLGSDSIHLETSPSQASFHPLAYDAERDALFVIGGVLVDNTIAFYQGNRLESAVTLAGVRRAGFIPLSLINGLENPFDIQISVYPNPTPDVLEVRFPAPTRVFRYRIADAKGRTLLAGVPRGMDGFQVDLSNLPRGGYFLEVHSAEGNASEAVVKW